MSAATKAKPVSRIEELNEILDGFPTMADAAREMPEAWNERAALIRKERELEALAAKRAAEKEAAERAAAFTPTIEEFRKRAQPVAQKFNAETAAVAQALEAMRALEAEYPRLYAEGRAAGVSVPPLHELCGITQHRLARVHSAIHFLKLADQ